MGYIERKMAEITCPIQVERLHTYFSNALVVLREDDCPSDAWRIKLLKLQRHVCLLRMLELREGYTFFDMPVDVVVDNLHKIHESNEPYVKFWFHRYEQSMMWEVSKLGGII